jgi:lysophospholipase L1-like esterase
VNSLGFRGPEVPKKPENEFRILALGDSMVYGQGVDEEHIMTARLQAMLDERRPECHVRVVNMGVRAYQTNQELALFKKFGFQLHPDAVLLFFYLNDFDSTNIAKRYAQFKNVDWYMFDLGGKPEGEALEAWKFRQLMRHSSVIAHLYRSYVGLRARNDMEFRLLRGEEDPSLDQRIEEIGGYIHEFNELAKTHKFAFRLIAMIVAVQIGGQYPHARYQSELRKFSDRDGIPFLDMLPAFERDSQITRSRHQIPFDGHPDTRGNEIMAETVADDLVSHGPGCLAK